MHLDHETPDRKLKHALSMQDLFFLCMGGIIGSGWLFAVLGAAAVAGPAVIISWIIGGILIMFIALTYAELSGMIPRSGAIVRYPHLTHGGFTGFILGWAYLLSSVAVPSIEAIAVVSYSSSYLPFHLTYVDKASNVTLLTASGVIFALLLMIAFFCLNYFGVRLFSRLNTIITWWKFILPVLTFILLFFAFKGSNFTAGNGFFALGLPSVFQAIAVSGIVFAYGGFRQGLDFGGEARNPQRDVPRATLLAVAAAIVIYLLLQVAFIGAINWAGAGVTLGNWAKLGASSWANAPFASELRSSGFALLVSFVVFLNIDAWVSPAGTGLVYTGTCTRTIFGMSMDGYFPSLFTRMSRYGIPLASLVLTLVIGVLFLLPLPSWYLLVGFISSASVLTYIMGGAGLTVLRRTASELHRPFRLSGASILAPISFIAAGLIFYWAGTSILNYVIPAVFVGLPLYAWFYAPRRLGVKPSIAIMTGVVFLVALILTAYFGPLGAAAGHGILSFGPYVALVFSEIAGFTAILWAAARSEHREEFKAGLWLIAFIFAIYILSYFGPYGPLPAAQQIPFPFDTLIAAVIALGAYFWASFAGYRTPEVDEIVRNNEAVIAEDTGVEAGAAPIG